MKEWMNGWYKFNKPFYDYYNPPVENHWKQIGFQRLSNYYKEKIP